MQIYLARLTFVDDFLSVFLSPQVAAKVTARSGVPVPCRVVVNLLGLRCTFTLVGRELRGPVLEVAVMEGRILAAAGNRVEALELQGSVLQRVAFFDAQLLVSSLSTIKNFMLLGDVHKGLTFIHCTNSLRQLAELSKVSSAICLDDTCFSLGVACSAQH